MEINTVELGPVKGGVLNVAPHHCRDDRWPFLQGQCSSALGLASQLSDAEKT